MLEKGKKTDFTAYTVAPLANVSLCANAVERAMRRPGHLPGMVCMYGPAGWGKSKAATYCSLKYRGYYVQCQETWNGKAILHYILATMGISPKQRVWEMAEQVCEQLAKSGRPLIVDELDKMVEKKSVELIRDLYEGSGAVILLIGEQNVYDKLQKWERFHRRVLEWVQAAPCDIDDTAHLRRLYHPEVEVAKDLLVRITEVSDGSAGRVCLNLSHVAQYAATVGLDAVSLQDWGDREFLTGSTRRRYGA
ncbi:MAG: AAA family ATPase [Desulfobulbus sp.]|jgi:DNA transposition AAA+ family ATPase|uniref:AAA family ATPase n=1 Tax=Desulfobulbus sp. TaxID=895 RepID=UPI00284730E2|nr:AAA family ATPase [Desulfobulbus sp.]MDR2551412.1 AAA family ATPase [Desulfobulbus sp.]